MLQYRLVMEDKKIEELIMTNNKLVEENNKLIKKVYQYIKWRRIFTALYWVLIIGTVFGLFFFLEPYINQLIDTYQGATDTLKNIGQ